MSQQSCDLCASTHSDILYQKDRHGKDLNTAICCNCGLIMHSPMPSEAEIAHYYANDYRKDYHGEQRPSDKRIMRAWHNGERILSRLVNHIPAPCRVFEIGAGIGCTVKAFEHHGYEASGIEPNKDFNSFTQQELHAKVENTNLFDLESKQRCDLALLIHVIEHFTAPSKALKKIHQLIADDGYLYIECPNIAAPFAHPAKMFHFAHTYNFSPETLIALASRCGFERVQVFSDEDDPNLAILFRKTDAASIIPTRPEHANELKYLIKHCKLINYHLRPVYLKRRIIKLASYAKELLFCRIFVRWLLKQLSQKT